jgi:hypothetical protein
VQSHGLSWVMQQLTQSLEVPAKRARTLLIACAFRLQDAQSQTGCWWVWTWRKRAAGLTWTLCVWRGAASLQLNLPACKVRLGHFLEQIMELVVSL